MERAYDDVKLREIALTARQRERLSELREAGCWLPIRNLRTDDVLCDYGLVDQGNRLGSPHSRITTRGRSWAAERHKAGRVA